MQFLAVGRSLDRIDDSPSRYRMTQQNLLPKFGSSRLTDAVRKKSRPVSGASETKAAGSQDAQPRRGVLPNQAADGPTKAGWIAKVFGKVRFKNPMHTIDSRVETAPSGAVTARAYPLGRWTMLSDVSLFKNPFGKTPKPEVTRQALQTELLLDAVKPVRNDLSDCDLEVVSASGRTAQTGEKKRVDPPEELTSIGTNPKNPEPTWGRIKTQLFGAGKP